MQIEVKRLWGRKELYIDGFPQSTRNYRNDWLKLLRQSGVLHKPNQKVLLLGMGGGDIIKLLTSYQPTTKITAVEIVEELVEVAAKHFGITQNENLNIKIADAKDYMQKNKDIFDLVIVDLYSGDDVPKFVTSQTFLAQIAAATGKHGQTIFNYASHGFKREDFELFESKLCNVFDSVKKIKIWGHMYYLASKI